MDAAEWWTAAGSLVAAIALGAALSQGLVTARDRREKLRASSTDNVGSPITIGTVIPPTGKLPNVRGRNAQLSLLKRSLRKPSEFIYVITGMGGVGKSALALSLASTAQRRKWLRRPTLVWWISAADTALLSAGLVGVARQIGATESDLLSIQRLEPDGPQRLWKLLAKLRHRWLLVLDNADVLNTLSVPGPDRSLSVQAGGAADGDGWIRPSSRGLIVVTSRISDRKVWGYHAKLIELDLLEESDATQVLLDLAPRGGTMEEAATLAQRLGLLPLALHLAGSTIASKYGRWSTFEAYRKALDSVGTRLLMPDPDTPAGADRRAAITRTWELSLDALEENGVPQARPLLRLLSCYAPAVPIPVGLFTSLLLGDEQSVEGLFSHKLEQKLEQGLHGLARVGLIGTQYMQVKNADDCCVVVHPLVAEASRLYLLDMKTDLGAGARQADDVGHAAVALLVTAVNQLRVDNPADWPAWQLIGPHMNAALASVGPRLSSPDIAISFGAVARVIDSYISNGAYAEALALGQAGSGLDSLLPSDHSAALSMKISYAFAIGRIGRWREAESEFRRVLIARRRELGPEHVDTLAARHFVARAIGRLGRWREAEPEFRSVFCARARTLGLEHPDTLMSRHYVARALGELGHWLEAEEEFRQVLEVRVRVLGADHPDTLTTRHYVARAVGELGRWAEAEVEVRGVLDARSRILGDDHPDTLASRQIMALCAAQMGRWRQAAVEFSDVLGVRLLVLGAEHPDTLNSRRRLAWTQVALGRFVEGYNQLLDIISVQQRVLGIDHPEALRSTHNLGTALVGLGKSAEATIELQKVYEAQCNVFSEDHPDALQTRRSLAEALAESGDMFSSERLLREVLEAQMRLFGEQHGDTIVTRRALRELLTRRGGC